MADKGHLRELKKGVEHWNAWIRRKRKRRPISRAEPSGADLARAILSRCGVPESELSRSTITAFADLMGPVLDQGILSKPGVTGSEFRLSRPLRSWFTPFAADLSGAELTRANLEGADLAEVDLYRTVLSGAGLIGANLTASDLSGADLSWAHMSGANLTGANLFEANLYEAELIGADLTGADLCRAILSQAKLSEANLSQCSLDRTVLANLDLSQVKELCEIRHKSASILDARTLRAGVNRLPDKFLLGVGYTLFEIENLRAMYSQGIQFYSCFLSYARLDAEVADRIYSDLIQAGVSCWQDVHDMKGGDFWRKQIREQFRMRDKIIVVCSEESLVRENVAEEIVLGMEEERKSGELKLFPIRLDNFVLTDKAADLIAAAMPAHLSREDWVAYLKNFHIPDFSIWKDHDQYKLAFERLLRDLKGKTGKRALGSGRIRQG